MFALKLRNILPNEQPSVGNLTLAQNHIRNSARGGDFFNSLNGVGAYLVRTCLRANDTALFDASKIKG